MSTVRFLAVAILLSAIAVSAGAAPVPREKPNDRELHIVCQGLREARGADGKTAVKVDRPGKEVTLVLGGNLEMAWDISVTGSTRLVKVVLIGLGQQTVGELPKMAEVVEACLDRQLRPARAFIPAATSAASDPFFRPMIRQIHALTGLEVTSFQGDPPTPVVVDQVQTDPRLRFDYPKPEPADGLPKLEFQALTFAPDRPGRLNATAYAKFTLTSGPATDARTLLPAVSGRPAQPINDLTVDPATKKGYALMGRQGVVEIDLDSQATTPLPPMPNGPRNRPPAPSGLAFDTRRGRLLVATATQLLAYSPKTAKWEEVRTWQSPRGFLASQAAGLAYQPATDSLYLLAEARGRDGLLLQRLDAAGEAQSETRLSGPFFAGLVGGGLSNNSKVQLLAVGDALVLVATVASHDLIERKHEVETFVYLIDPQTGKARLAWKHLDASPVIIPPGRPLLAPAGPNR